MKHPLRMDNKLEHIIRTSLHIPIIAINQEVLFFVKQMLIVITP